MGTTNMPHAKDRLFVSYVLSPKDLTKNMIIEAVAKESLCLEASKTFFTINSFKIWNKCLFVSILGLTSTNIYEESLLYWGITY